MPRSQTIVAGQFRLHVRGPHGARVESFTQTAYHTDVQPLAAMPKPAHRIGVVDRADAQAQVWSALRDGATFVHIAGEPGAGATTLLRVLGATASTDDFPDGAIYIRGVRGPALDVAQELYAQRFGSADAAYFDAPAIRPLFAAVRALVLLDDAVLSDAEREGLRDLFPSLRFVIADESNASPAARITLGPIAAHDAVALAEETLGTSVRGADRQAGLLLCDAVGALPGRVRMLGVVARETQTSFAALHAKLAPGVAGFGELVTPILHDLPALEQQILAALSLAKHGLDPGSLEKIAGAGVTDALAVLTRHELVAVTGGLQHVASSVATLVPAAWKTGALFDRTVAVMHDTIDKHAGDPAFGPQIKSAEAIVDAAFDASQWQHVVHLGRVCADGLAFCGAFGAWGRILDLVAVAADKLGDKETVALTNHQHGVQALALGHKEAAESYLITALDDRNNAGNLAAAAVTRDVLKHVGFRPEPEPDPTPPGPPPDPPWRRWLAIAATAVVVALAAFFWPRPKAVQIDEFVANPSSITAGAGVLLCARATGAVGLRLTPDVGDLPVEAEHCITVYPKRTTVYELAADSRDGVTASRTLTVDVSSPQVHIVAFTANPSRVKPGESTALCYRVTGAAKLQIVPSVGNVTTLTACSRVTPQMPVTYTLLAVGLDGRQVTKNAAVGVAAAPRASPSTRPTAVANRPLPTPKPDVAGAVYQFDATARAVAPGQPTSICAGVARGARASISGIGPLTPGITRCYRVAPNRTTVYRLHVAIGSVSADRQLTITVRRPADPASSYLAPVPAST